MRILLIVSLAVVSLHATFPQDKPNEVKGFKLPAEVVVASDDGYTKITPAFDDGIKVLDVRWVVVSSGGKAPPKYDPLGAGNESSLIVSVPRSSEEQIIVYAVALIQGEKGPWLTEAALTVVKTTGPPAGGDPVPVQPPGPPEPDPNVDAALAKAKGLHAFFLFNLDAADRASAQVTQSGTVAAKLAKSAASWHEFDYRAKEVKAANLAGKFQPAQLPVLIVLDGNKKPAPVLAVTPLKLSGTLSRDEAAILSAFAKAVK